MKRLLVILTLALGTASAFAQTYVSGTIAGQTWKQANSPYIVKGDVFVASLVIEPGVKVLFDGPFLFEVAGQLKAVGTEQDSIIFTRTDNATGWKGIFFNFSTPGTELRYCRIERSINGGLYIDRSFPKIGNCTISRNLISGINKHGAGIFSNVSLVLSDCDISHNSITNNVGVSTDNNGGGIYIDGALTR